MKLIITFLVLLCVSNSYAQIIVDKNYRKFLKGKKINRLEALKRDYVDKHNRGTVKFQYSTNPTLKKKNVKNYAFHKVSIPNGTTVKRMNFAQRYAHTQAVKGKNLTFINCNLENVEIDPTWTIINSRVLHTRETPIVKGNTTTYLYEREVSTNVWETIHILDYSIFE